MFCSCASWTDADGPISTCPSCSSILCRVMSCPIARATRSASCTMPATGRRPPSLPLCGEASAIGQFPGATVPIHARGKFCRGIWRSKFRFARGPLGERAKGSNPSDSLVALHGSCPMRIRSRPGGSPLRGQCNTSRSCRICSIVWRVDGTDGQ